MKKVIIAKANLASLDFVVDYALKCNFKKYNQSQFEKLKARYLKRLKKDDYQCFIAQTDKKIVGYIDLDIRSSDCLKTIWINEIFVKKNYRRLGVGDKLIKYAEKIGRELGFDSIYMNTEPENYACLKMVEKRKYKRVQYILRKKI